MYEGVIHGVLKGQPLRFNNSTSSVLRTKGTTISNNMISNVDLRASSLNSCEYDHDLGTHIEIAEDFFIEDLSEFSNEDIAAPIKNAALLDTSSLRRHSDNYTSASASKDPSSTIKSDCTPAHTSSSGSVLLPASPTALDPLHIEMDSSLSLPSEEEMGFEWLTSLGDDDNLIYGASNFCMDSFLLSSAEPFGGYDRYEDGSKVKMGHIINGASTNDEEQGHHGGEDHLNGIKELDATMFVPHSTGSRSARTKRVRSVGWSSSSILCSNGDNNSPTDSLNSTSQIMPNPQYSSPTLMCKQEEKSEQHGYGYTTTHHNVELISSISLGAPISRDKPFTDQAALNGNWAKEDVENAPEESVSNGTGGLQPRRCTHCLSHKTPQWRAGPEGPKTLCNACGVRYKSGRLFEEYRPAKSPTFLSYKHSNSHKKVMEMRRRKSFHHHHHQRAAALQTYAPPPASSTHTHVDADPLLANKLKIKLNSSHLEPHSQFSDVTLISTRTALESHSSFLY